MERPEERRRRPGRAYVVAAAAVVVLVIVLLIVTQVGKWTCNPPGGVWVEGPDHCFELP